MAMTIIVIIVQKGKKLIGLGAECLASSANNVVRVRELYPF